MFYRSPFLAANPDFAVNFDDLELGMPVAAGGLLNRF
jgi:hypothetical protein